MSICARTNLLVSKIMVSKKRKCYYDLFKTRKEYHFRQRSRSPFIISNEEKSKRGAVISVQGAPFLFNFEQRVIKIMFKLRTYADFDV